MYDREPKKPTAAEDELIRSAVAKPPNERTERENKAIHKATQYGDWQRCLEAYEQCPKFLYRRWSQKARQQLEQISRAYGTPLIGDSIDLSALVSWLHRFIDDNATRLRDNTTDDSATRIALEQAKLAKLQAEARAAELKTQRAASETIPRADVQAGFQIIANHFRSLGDAYLRQLPDDGREAHAMLQECWNDIRRELTRRFETDAEIPNKKRRTKKAKTKK